MRPPWNGKKKLKKMLRLARIDYRIKKRFEEVVFFTGSDETTDELLENLEFDFRHSSLKFFEQTFRPPHVRHKLKNVHTGNITEYNGETVRGMYYVDPITKEITHTW